MSKNSEEVGPEGVRQLTGSNYENWRFRVKQNLDAVEVSSVVTGEAAAVGDAARAKWELTDRKAKPVLVGFVADEILDVVREKQMASEMWKPLEEIYAERSVSRKKHC